MKTRVAALPDNRSGADETANEVAAVQICGPRFVDEVIQALVELDTEHLEALAAAAERFRKDAVLRMTPHEVAEMETKMRLFAAVLAETRRNLRILALSVGMPSQYGYKAERTLWAD